MEESTNVTSSNKEGTLNIMCAICNEFYKNTDRVYSTTICGHLFHQQCLFRWLNRSKTCPQCRRSCHNNRVHRVYLNFGERSELDDLMDEDASSNLILWTLLEDTDSIPSGAIKCGTDLEGNDAYVARVYISEDLLPANFVPKKKTAYSPWNCQSHSVTENIELLVDCDCSWVAACNGEVPENSVVTGYTEHGENLYTGRAQYEGIMLGGKVHQSHGVLYMPYKGEEVNVREYEVLVRNVAQEEQPEESPRRTPE